MKGLRIAQLMLFLLAAKIAPDRETIVLPFGDRREPAKEAYGRTVKLVTPGPPAAFDHGPHPASDPEAQIAPEGHARTMPLNTVPAPLSFSGA